SLARRRRGVDEGHAPHGLRVAPPCRPLRRLPGQLPRGAAPPPGRHASPFLSLQANPELGNAVSPLLLRLRLGRPELQSCAMYDWANSVLMTTVLQIFPLFFTGYAAATLGENVARTRFAFATSAAVVLVGLLGPVLGALADVQGNKKTWLGLFL